VNYLPLIMLGVLLNAGAQLLLKEGMRRIGYFEFAWANFVPSACSGGLTHLCSPACSPTW